MADLPRLIADLKLDTKLAPVIQKQIERNAPTLAMLLGNAELVRDNKYTWVVQGDGVVAESVAEGSDPTNFGLNEELTAEVALKNHRAPFRLSSEAITVAFHNGSPAEQKYALAKAKLEATEGLVKDLEKQVHSAGAGTYTMASWRDMLGVGSYAGIDGSSKTFWRSTVLDLAGAAPTDGYVAKTISKIRNASGTPLLKGVTSHAVMENLIATFKAGRNFTQSTLDTGKVTFGETSFPAIWYNGVEIVAVSDAYHNNSTNQGDIVFVSPDKVKLIYQPYVDGVGESTQTGFLGFDYLQLGATGNNVKGYVRTRMNVLVTRRNSCGIIKNVAGLAGYFS